MFELFHRSKHQLIETEVTTEQWTEDWKKENERASLLCSGLHFSHCKAHAEMVEVAKIKYKLVNLATRGGAAKTIC